MNHVEILVLALLLDALLGEPEWLWSRIPHPVVVIGSMIERLDNALNQGSMRKLKGILVVVLLVILGGVFGYFFQYFSAYAGQLPTMIFAAILIAHRTLVDHISDVGFALRSSLQEGRDAVANVVSRDTKDMTEPQVARAAIESAAENMSDGVVAPVFWFLIGGLPGLIIYKIVNTLDSMIGYKNETYADFGWASARLDDLLNFVPARITAYIMAFGQGILAHMTTLKAEAAHHRSPNAGWPEAAMAMSLDVSLAGPRSYDGEMQELAWVNAEGFKEVGPAEIHASVGILWQTWMIMLSAITFLAALSVLLRIL